MRSDENLALRELVDSELDACAPGPAPFADIVQQGRGLIIRRRLSYLAGLAVIASAAAAVIIFIPLSQPPRPVTPLGYAVTYHRPGNGSAHGLIGYGTVNNNHWQAAMVRQGKSICFRMSASVTCPTPARRLAKYNGPEFSITLSDGIGIVTYIDVVPEHTTYVKVQMTNGQILKIVPVSIFGARYAQYVAWAVPFNGAIAREWFYSKTGPPEPVNGTAISG